MNSRQDPFIEGASILGNAFRRVGVSAHIVNERYWQFIQELEFRKTGVRRSIPEIQRAWREEITARHRRKFEAMTDRQFKRAESKITTDYEREAYESERQNRSLLKPATAPPDNLLRPAGNTESNTESLLKPA